MRQPIVLCALLCSCGFAAAEKKPDLAVGFGLESRAQRDVNPDYLTPQAMGQLYAKLRFWPWALEIETGREEKDTGSGSLHVKSESTLLGLWGRYEFREPGEIAPFAGMGVGTYFDNVDTAFVDSHDKRSGVRKFLGVGGGVSAVFWDHLQVELEGRVLSLEETKDPVLSGLVRVGCQI